MYLCIYIHYVFQFINSLLFIALPILCVGPSSHIFRYENVQPFIACAKNNNNNVNDDNVNQPKNEKEPEMKHKESIKMSPHIKPIRNEVALRRTHKHTHFASRLKCHMYVCLMDKKKKGKNNSRTWSD